eukprot:5301855-Prymnesium_polylepis.1
MHRVLYNTLGCHPLLQTEAHEITHLSVTSAPHRSRAHAQNYGPSTRPRAASLTFPVLVRHPDKRTCLPKSSTRLRYNCITSHVITASELPSLSPLRKLDILSAALRS